MIRVVFNQKGGVGKSTLVCNLAAIAAAEGESTLVIDLDAQGNSTHYLLGGEVVDEDAGSAGLFADSLSYRLRSRDPMDFVAETPFENLHLMPGGPPLAELQTKLETKLKIYKLREALESLKGRYKQIWIDTPPALNFYTLSALIAAQRCLIPFDCDDFSRQALYRLMENVEEIKADHNKKLKIEGIVVNQFNARASHPRRVVDELIAEKLPVLPQHISSSVKIKESHEAARPMVFFDGGHKLTKEYRALYAGLKHK
ncbi:MAG: ParA family protein [Xanthomonadales bacterium]|nr:ParA family protein [Xanthomonadales bacterium]